MNAKRESADGAGWDELRIFLAVVRGGSFLAAARTLNVAVSTVSRRIAALEKRTGAALLERRSDGAFATEAGRQLGELAAQIELDLAATLRDVSPELVRQGSKSLRGTVRISAGDGFSSAITESIGTFVRLHPEVEFEFVVESRVADLHKREADIAVRTVQRQEASLIYSRLGDLQYSLWASEEYLRIAGRPKTVSDLKQHRFIGFGSPLDKHASIRWLKAMGVRQIATRASTFRVQLLAVKNHLGIAPLPKAAVRNAVEVLPGIDAPSLPLFFVSHPQSLRRPAVRAFADVLVQDLRSRLA